MIFIPADAQLSKDIGEDDEDVVNQVRPHHPTPRLNGTR